jgi:putative DNA methylase
MRGNRAEVDDGAVLLRRARSAVEGIVPLQVRVGQVGEASVGQVMTSATTRRSEAAATVEPAAAVTIRSPLRHLDPETVSLAAQRESRNRETHLPPTGVYRWWARRTEAVTGALIDAAAHDHGVPMLVSDPFSGGGVIPLVAALRGHRVYAQDLNEWASSGLQGMLELPDAKTLDMAVSALAESIAPAAAKAYSTSFSDGAAAVISHTFRVAITKCSECGAEHRVFPHALVSLKVRAESQRTEAFLACRRGHLFEGDSVSRSACSNCDDIVDPAVVYTRRRLVTCVDCGSTEQLERRIAGNGLRWEVVLVERSSGRRREIAIPTEAEIAQAECERWRPVRSLGSIRDGHETRVLLRHGFNSWEDLYPRRQRWFLETLLTQIDECDSEPAIREALRIAIVGATEMAGLLSRWDRYYLKSFESMANHRFNFTTFTAEPNVWGTDHIGRGTVTRRLKRLVKIAEWMQSRRPEDVDVTVVQGSSERQLLADRSVHLALTDPPYHDDVQYGELSLPLRAWAGMSLEDADGDAAVNPRTKATDQTALLTRIFRETARTLRSDGHLLFSFANRDPRAWIELIGALDAAGLRAVGAEMVHSENESDLAKRNGRACTLDLILDLAPRGGPAIEPHHPKIVDSDEGRFLATVAEQVLLIGALPKAWADGFRKQLEGEAFLSSQRVSRSDRQSGA